MTVTHQPNFCGLETARCVDLTGSGTVDSQLSPSYGAVASETLSHSHCFRRYELINRQIAIVSCKSQLNKGQSRPLRHNRSAGQRILV
jgi:hypothetical protein